MSLTILDESFNNFFLTSYNIPIRSPPPAIQFINKLNEKKTSIFNDYASEIKGEITALKITKRVYDLVFNKENKNNRMYYLSDSFTKLIIDNPSKENILKFSKIYSLFVFYEKSFMVNVSIVEKILKNIKDKDFSRELAPVLYKNPIQIYNYNIDQKFILQNIISGIFNKIYDENFRELAINSFNTIYFGNYMDMSLPSIGPLYTIFDYSSNLNKHSKTNIYHFMINILNNKDSFIDHLPIKNTHFEKTISKLLLIKTDKENMFSLNFDRSKIGLNEGSRLESLIENAILGIRFSLSDVLKEGTKNTSKIKNEYILPYIIKNNKIEKLRDLGEAGDKTKLDVILKHNRETVGKIIELYTTKRDDFDSLCRQDPLLEENMKNCLGVFVYISISIFYDVYKYYFDKLTEILNEFIENDRFKITDMRPAFDFVEKIKKSLYNFKKILENCFYHLFLPSRLTPKYGIRIQKEKGYFEVENKLLASFEHIILNFPFNFKEELKRVNNPQETIKSSTYLIDDENSKNRFINFALSHKSMYDIINPEETLYIGTFTRDAKTTFDIYWNVFYKYLESLHIQATFNDVLIKYFLRSMKKNVPIELFRDVITKLDSMKQKLFTTNYSDEMKTLVNNLVVDQYKDNYKYSTNCLIQLANIKRDIFIYGKEKYTESYEYSLNSLIFYHEALVYEYIFNQDIKESSYKKSALKMMKELKEYYESEILKISKEVQKQLMNKKKEENEKLKTLKNNKTSNQNQKEETSNLQSNGYKVKINNSNQILLKIKKLIERNDILIPYEMSGKIYFISLFDNTDNLEWNRNVNTNKHLILLGESSKDVLKDKSFRVLKEEEFNKFKNMSDLEKTKYVIDFIQNKDTYLDKTSLSSNDIFKNFVENNCNNMGCDQVLLSFNQLKKIIHLKK